jgi:hypothetical protein
MAGAFGLMGLIWLGNPTAFDWFGWVRTPRERALMRFAGGTLIGIGFWFLWQGVQHT